MQFFLIPAPTVTYNSGPSYLRALCFYQLTVTTLRKAALYSLYESLYLLITLYTQHYQPLLITITYFRSSSKGQNGRYVLHLET